MRTLIIVVLAIYASAAAAEIYSWKDADGKVHYSDQAPGGDNPSVKTVPLPADNAPKTVRPKPTTSTSAGSKSVDAIEKEKAAAKNAQEACEKAKANMQEFQERPRRTAVAKGGKFYALDGEERAEEEAKLQTAIDRACR